MKKQDTPYEEKINEFNNKITDKNKRKTQDDKKNTSKIVINVAGKNNLMQKHNILSLGLLPKN
jgi:hypothetical protein